jgi:hypothetical protein
MENLDLALIALATIVAGIAAEVAKRAGLPGKYSAGVAVVAGALAGWLGLAAGIAADETNTAAAILAGLIGGATAAGLYSGVKAATGGYDGLGDRPEDREARARAGLRPADQPIDPDAD